MDNIIKLDRVVQFNAERGQKTLHPLVSVLDQSKSKLILEARYLSALYIVFLKEGKSGELRYGRQHYDYEDGTMLFIAPGQVFGHDGNGKILQPTGWALVFHPDLIHGTILGRQINNYGFFSYDVNEALHLSDREREVIIDCMKKIHYEMDHPIDKHSKALIVSNIELLLKYCLRFYDRQFITRDNLNKDLLVRLEELLDDYFQSNKPQIVGLPSVAYCAEEINLSPKYFGDLIKKETGKSAQEFIQQKMIAVAKERILDISKSVSEVAYELGFKYPSHFTRFFKQHTGHSPNEYRSMPN